MGLQQNFLMWRISTKNNFIESSPFIPPFSFRVWRDFCFLMTLCIAVSTAWGQSQFVVRSQDTLKLASKPFYFLGTNAYYLLEQSARGDTSTVRSLFETASALHFNVVRLWGFFDSPDSTNPAVVQFRPGVFNEHALRALDYVIYQARLHDIRVLIPFVNSWDDYGGMNQYVRWRSQIAGVEDELGLPRFSIQDMQRTVNGAGNRSYQYAITTAFAHDDFYTDAIIKGWYKNYISSILNRVNTYTATRYKDEPFIFGWELANEPRSSDHSARLVYDWVREMSSFIKSIDANHLVGTGEEGFDTFSGWYSLNSYNNQQWLFDGSQGVSFSLNSSVEHIDFSSCHLYPEAWNLSNNAGNVWIRDHIRAARSMRKPLIIGEFGVREQKSAVYESWSNTALLDGAAGLLVWQVLEGSRTDNEGFGFRCPEERTLCSLLLNMAARFQDKFELGTLPQPSSFSLLPNYPNPFNGVTTISYVLPLEAHINLTVYNLAGQRVATIVDAVQGAGERKELFEANELATGAYFYRLTVTGIATSPRRYYIETRKLLLVR